MELLWSNYSPMPCIPVKIQFSEPHTIQRGAWSEDQVDEICCLRPTSLSGTLSRAGRWQRGEINIESDFTSLPRETAFSSVARTGTGNFLPRSWFSWQKLFILLRNFSPNRPNPWLVSKVFGNLFLITVLVASVFCGCSWGDALLLGDIYCQEQGATMISWGETPC